MWSRRLCKNLGAQLLRNYNLHEYQSLLLLQKFGIPTPINKVAFTAAEARDVAREIGDKDVVVKAQVLAGGRGKGKFSPNGFQGGVHIVSQDQVLSTADNMIGKFLITKQTGSQGKPCDKVIVMQKLRLSKEFYLAFLLDRKFGGPVLVFSQRGGMDIEEVASKEPKEIHKIPISLQHHITSEIASEVTKKLGFSHSRALEIKELLTNLYSCFTKNDLLMLEINPLGITDDDKIVVCDAKLNFDDNAIYRQKESHDSRDLKQENMDELVAHDAGLSYISMDGSIGCLVNGAGLAMATMDLIKLMGGSPANFLDVGGGAQEDQIVSALQILQTNSNVDSVLINIFGGIMRCDIIAHGLITAVEKVHFKKPIVARLCGTNWEEAKEIISKSSISAIYEPDEEAAVKKVVAVSKITRLSKQAGLDVIFNSKME